MATEAEEVESEEEAVPSSSKSVDLANQDKESEILLNLKSISEESLQISELSEMEKTYSAEVITLLKQLIEPLNSAFHIKPTSISKTDSSIQDVTLTSQGIVFITHNYRTVNSRPLESFSTEILVRILGEVIPEAKKLLVEKRQKVMGRVGLLEKIAREFRKLPSQAAAPRQNWSPKGQQQLNQQSAANERTATPNAIQRDALKATLAANSR